MKRAEKLRGDILNEAVDHANKANSALKAARIIEIEAGEELARQEVDVVLRGLEGKNQEERDADLYKETEQAHKDLAAAKIERIIKGTRYSNSKRTLRVIELIYQVRAEKEA